jgi:hypothetical protein
VTDKVTAEGLSFPPYHPPHAGRAMSPLVRSWGQSGRNMLIGSISIDDRVCRPLIGLLGNGNRGTLVSGSAA